MGEIMRPPPRRTVGEHAVALARWVGIGRIVAVCGSVLAVVAGSFFLLGSGSGDGTTAATSTTTGAAAGSVTSSTAETSTTSPAWVVVHVAGAVAQPGVYQLEAGSRVADAVRAAGEALPDAVLDAVNLAAVVTDGQQVYVPRAGEAVGPAAGSGAGSTPSAAPLDLNAATVEQLDTLPGIGPVTAAAIVRHREEAGPFTSVDQLLDVPGIGPSRLASLIDLVRV